MAVSRDYNKINIILNNSAVQFAIDFDTNYDDYGNAINIEVYLGLERLVQNTDFTISGKTINYPDAVNHQGEKLTIFRLTPIEQPVDFVDNGNFTLEDIEAMGDRAIMILQEQGVNLADTINAQESALRAEQYKDIAIEKASDAEDWAVGTRSDGQSPQHSTESSKYYAEYVQTTVGDHATALDYLKDYSANVDTVAGIGTQVNTVAGISSNVTAVAGNATNINTVAGNNANITTVAGVSSSVSTVAGISTSVSAVAGNKTNIDTVAGISSNVTAVAGNATNINTVAGNNANITTVAGVSSSIPTVAANASDISTVASNISAILDADDYASLSRQYSEGKKLDGTDVSPGDDGYDNNSKYYAGQASTSATVADNARIASVTETISPDDGGENVITMTYKDGTTKTFSVFNGHQGTIMYPAFDVDAATGSLIMYTDEDYTGVLFRLTAQGYIEAYRDIS